ncbi:MAG: J domain-containing protein [Chitinophagales bacterium]
MKLSKTPLSIRKERELNDLKKQLKKTKTQLKRSTTRLTNLQKGITKLQQNIANEMLQNQEKMKALREELLALLKKIMASKKVDKESRAQAKELFKELGELDDTVPNMEDFEGGDESEYEGRGGRFAFFEQFRAETPKEEQRSIRKVFIKLAARFHPDKASTPQEADRFHKIMQRINTAYERNDILTLLDMEAQYADYQKEEVNNEIDESAIVSLLDQEISKAAIELDLLEGQLNRVKAETKDLRASDAGEMHREATRAKKYGVDFVADMKEQMESAVEQLIAVKGVMEELLKKGTLTNEMLIKAGLIPDLSMFFDEFDDEDDEYDDDDDFFGDMDTKDLQKMFKDMFGL